MKSSALPRVVTAAFVVSLVLAVLSAASPGLFGRAVQPVVVGAVYRADQLSDAEILRAVERLNLRSIVAIRSGAAGRGWSDDTMEALNARGVEQYDVELSPRLLPSRETVLELVGWFRDAPKPILLHGSAGGDRAGLASAIARLVASNGDLDAARTELRSYRPLNFEPEPNSAELLDHYARFLAESGARSTPAQFEEWVRTAYMPYPYRAEIEVLSFPERVAPGEMFTAGFRVTNRSQGAWTFSAASGEHVKLGLLLRPELGGEWDDFGRGGDFTGSLAPGSSTEIAATLTAPEEPGRYRVRIDMVEEHVTWFEEQGSRPLERLLVVEGSP